MTGPAGEWPGSGSRLKIISRNAALRLEHFEKAQSAAKSGVMAVIAAHVPA